MLYVYALLIILAGVAAGYFAGLVPIIVVSVIGIIFLITISRDKEYSGGAGPAIAVMGLALLLFLVSMGVTALVVRIGSISAPDFSAVGSWLKKVLLR